jgi:drug/metabolite transporter (DMT)-like permease
MEYVYAGLTGLFFGLQGAYGKVLGRRISPVLLTWGLFAFALPYLLVFLLVDGVPDVEWRSFLWATGASVVANIIGWNLFFRALKKAPLAHTMPFTAFTPVFLIPVAYELMGELPDAKGFFGVLLIIAGAYGIHLQPGRLLEPFRMLARNRGTRLMLLVALIWSISAPIDKVAVLASSRTFYAFSLHLLLSLAYLPYMIRNMPQVTVVIRDNLRGLSVLGLIAGLLIFFQFTALTELLVSYVIAFKRAGVFVSVLLGIIFFKEGNVTRHLVCTGLMVAGVFLLVR